MSDTHDRHDPEKPQSSLAETYTEFLSYARKRRARGPRQVASASPSRPPQWTWDRRQLVMVVASLFFFVGVIAVVQWLGSSTGRDVPDWVTRHKQRRSSWVNLPKPQAMGQVPDHWGDLRLGMRRTELDSTKLMTYDSPAHWADIAYVPDPAQPDVYFGLSFHKGIVYKIAVHLGEESMVAAAPFVASSMGAYGAPRGYEYLTAGAAHAVTIFQTESRAFKLDSIRRADDMYLCEMTLLDLDVGAERERARVKGGG